MAQDEDQEEIKPEDYFSNGLPKPEYIESKNYFPKGELLEMARTFFTEDEMGLLNPRKIVDNEAFEFAKSRGSKKADWSTGSL